MAATMRLQNEAIQFEILTPSVENTYRVCEFHNAMLTRLIMFVTEVV